MRATAPLPPVPESTASKEALPCASRNGALDSGRILASFIEHVRYTSPFKVEQQTQVPFWVVTQVPRPMLHEVGNFFLVQNLSGRLREMVAEGVERELEAVGEIELSKDRSHVVAHGRIGQKQFFCNLRSFEPLRDQRNDFALSCC